MVRRNKKDLPIIIVLSLLIALLLTACWGSDEEESETVEETAVQTVGINQPVRVGDTEWVVTGTEKLPPNSLEGEQPKQGIFLVVHMKCKNLSTSSQSVPGVNVYDSEGNEGGNPLLGWSVSTPPEWGPEIVGESLLAGGGEATGYMLYEVMPDAMGFKLEVYGFGLSEGVGNGAFVNLGI